MPKAVTSRRFVLHPDVIRSRNDGDRHYIGAAQLLRLYSVPKDARWVLYVDFGYREKPGDIHLFPREDGDYPLFDD